MTKPQRPTQVERREIEREREEVDRRLARAAAHVRAIAARAGVDVKALDLPKARHA